MLRLLGMKLLSRLLLLVCSLSALSLLLLSRCGLNIDEEGYEHGTGVPVSQVQQQQARQPRTQRKLALDSNQDTSDSPPESPQQQDTVESYVQLLQQREDENRVEVERLTAEIRSLKLEILRYRGASLPLDHEPEELKPHHLLLNISRLEVPDDCSQHVRRQVAAAEVLRGVSLNNEYEVLAFTHFTLSRIYPVDLGLGKRVVEKPIGYKRRDLSEALFKALETLNKNSSETRKSGNVTDKQTKHSKTKYNLEDFVEGLYRVDPTTGTQYDLYFRNKNSEAANYTKVTVVRPFAPLVSMSKELVPSHREKELVHIILPLSGRTSTFQSFMDKFVKIALKHDRRVHLTVVYFGDEGLSEARSIMSRVVQIKGNGNSLRLLALNETFSRGKGLRVGAERTWDNQPDASSTSDVLLFMCDVDVIFSARFLERCRWNARPGRRVYYPIVFSLYNPQVVYTLQGKEVPSETEQLVVSRDTGFWRDFGYGMTCQYRSDFLRVRGFDEDVVGWGGEDVTLYRKHVRSHVKVVRATDPGIFHIWHPKVCTGTVSAEQYRACIRSRALNEASHAQLGFLAFKDDIPSGLRQADNKKNQRPRRAKN